MTNNHTWNAVSEEYPRDGVIVQTKIEADHRGISNVVNMTSFDKKWFILGSETEASYIPTHWRYIN